MKLKKATMEDYDQIMTILRDGSNQLAEQGIDQWQGDYPNPDVVKNDIKNGWAYLAESADGMTVGTIAIVDGPDHSYDTMKGNWLIDTDKYVVLHRVAIHSSHAGTDTHQSCSLRSLIILRNTGRTSRRFGLIPISTTKLCST